MPSSPPFPTRPAGLIRPLVTAAEAYPVMEQMVRSARRRIWMSFRVFDPSTPLLTDTTGHETWRDLLARKLDEGVEIRIMLSDFDPVGADALHRMTWAATAHLQELQIAGDLRILPLRHEARAGRGLRLGLWFAALSTIEDFRKELNSSAPEERLRQFAVWPGLWRHLRVRRNRSIGWRTPRVPRLYPVTLHQKIIVVDDERAVIGGLDIDERRYDDDSHNRPAHQTWHDVSVELDGRVVADIAQHLADTWNDNRLRIGAYFRELNRQRPPDAQLPPVQPKRVVPPAGLADSMDDCGVRLLRTVSRNVRRRLFRISPRTELREIEDAHVAMIQNATDWLYLESQFFRSRRIAEALVNAAGRNRELSLVMILPGAPEEIAFEDRTGIGERFGEHLQAECVDEVKLAFGDRAAILSPVRPVRHSGTGRTSLREAEIIFVHSKVSIADGRMAIVGSANLNGRSMRWDTEAAVLFDTPSEVKALADRLARKWWRLGPEADHPLSVPDGARWANAAAGNAQQAPDQRQAFLVPYDPQPAREFGFHVPGLPEELV